MSSLVTSTIALLVTFKCCFYCEHCSLNAGPHRTEEIPLRLIDKVIREAYDIPSIKTIVFTGGEPTLYKNLRQAIDEAYRHGFITRIVTNAWWANSYDEARKFLENLYSAGLRELNISYDDMHLAYVNESNILNAALAASDLGLKIVIACTRHRYSRICADYIEKKLSELGLSDKVIVMEGFVEPLGRGEVLIQRGLAISRKISECCTCTSIIRTIAITPDGRVYACCGHITTYPDSSDLFCAGDLFNNKLGELVNKIRNNLLYILLFLAGPGTLFNIVRMLTEGYADENMITYGNCFTCLLMLRRFRKILPELAKKKREIMLSTIRRILNKNREQGWTQP